MPVRGEKEKVTLDIRNLNAGYDKRFRYEKLSRRKP